MKDYFTSQITDQICDTPKLGFLDRFLTLWIFLAMVLGISISAFLPAFKGIVNQFQMGTTSMPIAIGLILMIYLLARVRYEELPNVFRDWKVLRLFMFQNWIIAPLLMFAFAVIFLSVYPEYMIGLILIGITPCITMALVWNQLAKGNSSYSSFLNRIWSGICHGNRSPNRSTHLISLVNAALFFQKRYFIGPK